MDSAFHDLLDQVIAAGWDEQDVTAAVLELTAAHMLARAENAATDQAIRQPQTQNRPAIH